VRPRTSLPLLGLSIALLGVGLALSLTSLPHPDIAWPLYMAKGIVFEGAKHGVDYYEVNPPLYVWLCVIPMLIGRGLAMTPWIPYVLEIGLAGLVSLLLSLRILFHLGDHSGLPRPQVTIPILMFVMFLLPLNQFGQREHVALILTLPYVLLAASRVSGSVPPRRLASLVGLVGGLGVAMKPFFLPALLLVELLNLFRCGWRSLVRLEFLIVVGLGMAYIGAVMVLVPDYIPFALEWRALYGRYLHNNLWNSAFPSPVSTLPLFAVCVWLTARRSGVRFPAFDALLVASLGFWLSAIVQRKGFQYHYLAAAGYALLLIGFIVLETRFHRFGRPLALVANVARLVTVVIPIYLLGLAMLYLAGVRPRPILDAGLPDLIRFVKAEAQDEPILVLSSNPSAGWPLTLVAGAKWGSRFFSHWPLAGLYHDELWSRYDSVPQFRPLEKRVGIERVFHETMIEDLDRYQPRLILVLQVDSLVWGHGGATRLDYLAYLMPDPRFRQILSRYEDLGTNGRYGVYRRRDR